MNRIYLPGGTVVIATGNRGKLAEIHALLDPLGVTVRSQTEFGVSAVEETGLSFIENAILKARHTAAQTGFPALADDSGLEVDALDGAPGIYSARYAGADGDDAANNRKLLEALDGVASRAARFRCAIALLRNAHDPMPLVACGSWEGRILEAPRGGNGFGYDPLFLPEGGEQTAAELDPAEKNRISHRARALQQLIEWLGART